MSRDRFTQVSIESVAERLGMDVVRHRTLCPFHDGHHPSLSFSERTGTWRCWACGERGDAPALVMRMLGVGFGQARRWLEGEVSDGTLARQHRPAPRHEAEAAQADTEMLEFVTSQARLSPQAVKFLFDERGYSPIVVHAMRIGSISSGNRFAAMLEKVFGTERAVSSGLLARRSDGTVACAFATPCILLPYRDIQGRVTLLQSRFTGEREGVPRFQFTKGCRPPMFNMPVLRKLAAGSDLWIAEGPTDCMALASMGHSAMAIPSATLLTERHASMLAPYRLHMAPDADEAGEALFGQIEATARRLGTTLKRHPLPPGCKDVSDYYSKYF